MIKNIDLYINELLLIRNSNTLINDEIMKGWISNTIAHCYHLECSILMKEKINSHSESFFNATVAINRHYRDWGLDNVADIYNKVSEIAQLQLRKEF